MKRKVTIYLVILVTLGNLSALATILYLRWQKPYLCQPGSGFERVKKEVGLSQVQIQQFQVYRRAFHSELDSLDRLLADERRLLAEKIRQTDPDSVRIKDIVERIGHLQQQSQYRVIRHFSQIKEMLTPEQQERFFDIVLGRFVCPRQFPGALHPSEAHSNETQEK